MAKNKKPEVEEKIINDLEELGTPQPQFEPETEQEQPQPEPEQEQPEQEQPEQEQPTPEQEQPEPTPEQPEPTPEQEQPTPEPEQPEQEQPGPVKKKDGRGRPRKTDKETRERLFKEPTESQTKTEPKAPEQPNAGKQMVAISGNLLLQTIDLFGTNIVPIAAKVISKEIDLKPELMSLTVAEKAYLQPLCDAVAPDLKLGVWEMFFLGISTVYASKIIPQIK